MIDEFIAILVIDLRCLMPRLKYTVSRKCPKVIIKICAKLIGFKGNVLNDLSV